MKFNLSMQKRVGNVLENLFKFQKFWNWVLEILKLLIMSNSRNEEIKSKEKSWIICNILGEKKHCMLIIYPKIRSMQVWAVIKKKVTDNDKKIETKIIIVQFKESSKEK